jgi:flagellar biosynthesis/type III secretory pathway M-ring protein FliF/YscJ
LIFATSGLYRKIKCIYSGQKLADNGSGMYSGTFVELAIQVVKSWQVIFITVVFVAVMFLIGYVTRRYRRPRSVSKSKPKKIRTPKAAKATQNEATGATSSNDELGLEQS